MTPQTDPVQPGYAAASLTASAAPSPAAAVAGAFRQQGVKQRIYWRGQVYPSISAAAKAAGVSRQAFTEAMQRNRLHMVGTGPHKVCVDRRQPCAAHGWQWASQKDAAAALGVSDCVITARLNRGTFDALVLQRLGVKV
jgi:hypothetical protein